MIAHDPYIYGDRPPAYHGQDHLAFIAENGLVPRVASPSTWRAPGLRDIPVLFFGATPVVAHVWGRYVFRFPWPDVYGVDPIDSNSRIDYTYPEVRAWTEGRSVPLYDLIGPDLWMWYYTTMSIPVDDIDIWWNGSWVPVQNIVQRLYKNPRIADYWYGVDEEGFARIELPKSILSTIFPANTAGFCTDKHSFDVFLQKEPAAVEWYSSPERSTLRKFLNSLPPDGHICGYVLDAPTENTFERFLRYHEQGHILFELSEFARNCIVEWTSPRLLEPYLTTRLPPLDIPRYQQYQDAYSEIFADLWALGRLRYDGRDLETIYRRPGGALLRYIAKVHNGVSAIPPNMIADGIRELRLYNYGKPTMPEIDG